MLVIGISRVKGFEITHNGETLTIWLDDNHRSMKFDGPRSFGVKRIQTKSASQDSQSK